MSPLLTRNMSPTNVVRLGYFLMIWFHCAIKSTESKNTSKRVVTVSTLEIPPFYMEVKDEGEREHHGYIADMLSQMALLMNVTFDINVSKDRHFGYIGEDGNWNGMIGEVVSGKADIGAAPLSPNSFHMKHIDMSFPFLKTGLKIIIKQPNLREMTQGLFIIFKPFTASVWCFIILAYILTSIFLAIIGRISPYEWTNISEVNVEEEKRGSFNTMNCFWFTFSTFMWQGYCIAPRSYSGRILSVFWWIFVLFTLVLYIGSMAAHLLATRPKNAVLPFTNFKEMSEQNEVAYGALRSGSALRYFKRSTKPLERRIYDNIMKDQSVLTHSAFEGIERVRKSNGKYAYIMDGILAQYYIDKIPCDLMLVGDIGDFSYSFVTQKNSSLSSDINQAIIRLQEENIVERIHKKWMMGECAASIYWEIFMDNQAYFDKNTPVYNDIFGGLRITLFAGPLIILLIGMMLGVALLVAELFLPVGDIKRNNIVEEGHQLQDSFNDNN
ncbi:glutamate receptor 2 [Argonauta hians]